MRGLRRRVKNGLWTSGSIMALLGSAGVAAVVFAADAPEATPFGRTGNKGEGATSEQQGTERLDRSIDPAGRTPISTPKQDAQITLGGSRPTLEGEVLKIFGEDYLIKDQSGAEVRLRVTKDTNTVCGVGAGGGGAQTMTGRQNPREHQEIPPTAAQQEIRGQHGQQQQQAPASSGSEAEKGQRIVQEQMGQGQKSQGHQQMSQSQQGQERDQGQSEGMSARQERLADQSGTQSPTTLGQHSGGDVAVGSGFQVGDQSGCDFKVGDKVKAEVSDLGTALLLKKLSERELRATPGLKMPGPDVVPDR